MSVWLEFATLVVTVEGLRRKLDKFNAAWHWITICAWCKKIRDSEGVWRQSQPTLNREGVTFSHGICPICADRAYNAYRDPATSEGGSTPFAAHTAPLGAGATRNIESTSTAAA